VPKRQPEKQPERLASVNLALRRVARSAKNPLEKQVSAEHFCNVFSICK